MAAGRKPPVMPPRNFLAEGRIAGRKPPPPYRIAVQKQYERQRAERAMKPIAAIGGAPPPPRSVDLLAARNAVNPEHQRAIDRLGKIIRQAQDRAAREAEAEAATMKTLFSDLQAGGAPPEPRTMRPPKREPGRYGELKDGPPG